MSTGNANPPAGNAAHGAGHGNHHQHTNRTTNQPLGFPGGLSGGFYVFLVIVGVLILLRGCDGCGCNSDSKCYIFEKTYIEVKRGDTPLSVTSIQVPDSFAIDAFEPVVVHWPKPDGSYTTFIYPGGGADVNFDEVYGRRGKGDIKFSSPILGNEVEVIVKNKTWIKLQVPCKDED